jgi:hypothetical protein
MNIPLLLEDFSTGTAANQLQLYYTALRTLNRIKLHWEACVSDEACELTDWMGKMKELLDEF